MSIVSCYVGLDYHDETIRVCVLAEDGELMVNRNVGNDPAEVRRLEVRPGLTGWAQINGRNGAEWDDRLAMDLWYVENRSIWLDLRILGRTVVVVLGRKGIAAEGSATMNELRRPETGNLRDR